MAAKGEKHHKARLTPDLVRQLRAEYMPYVRGYHTLGKKYGVPWRTVCDAVNYATWRHVL